MNWYLKVFRQYADFGGRARRKEFWYFVLFNFIAAIVVGIIDALAGWDMTAKSSAGFASYGPCYQTYLVAALLPALALAVRRLHDLGKSGWWLFIGLIPLVGGIWLIVLYCQEGESRKNRYGADPKSAKPYFSERRRDKSMAIAFIGGAVVALTGSMVDWIQHDVFTYAPFQFWLIPSLMIVLKLLFGVFYLPVDDSRETEKRWNIAFVLLAISALIPVIQDILGLIGTGGNRDVPGLILANNFVWLLMNLALLALTVLLLLKSERKNIAPVAVSTIVLIIVGVVITLLRTFVLDYPISPSGIVLDIAYILLAVHCLQGKAAEEESAEEEDESLISPEPGTLKMTVSPKAAENLSPEDFEKPVDKELLNQWKESIAEQKNAAIMLLVLWGVGLLLLILLGGIVGLVLFFASIITAMVISLSKRKKVKESFSKLGISESELKQALDACSRRTA
jgi:uncharacterized membrane protein YhaH (DUF805 family)